MILTTTAHNDKDLLKALSPLSIPASIKYGDVNFIGKWDNNETVWFLGERKKLSDLIQCINDGRHIRQVQAAREAGFRYIFFILEAKYRKNGQTGLVQELRGNRYRDHESEMAYSRIRSYLYELEWYAGIKVYETKSLDETVRIIRELYDLFQRPPESHNSLKKIYHTPLPSSSRLFERVPSLRKRIAHELPEVGFELAGRLEKRFNTTKELINASEDELISIEGIGKKIANRIVEVVNSD